ncbi:hypothetical protein EB118_09885 [bacterium]|nr:hypothetical protein [bacterium]
MAKRNGGIIGPANTPTSSVAAGVWRLRDAFNSIKNGTWPLTRSVATNSLRFNRGSSDTLSRTFSTATNYKIQTFSAWIKRANISGSTTYRLIGGYNGSASFSSEINFNNDSLRMEFGGSSQYILKTTQLFRDVSAWYHILVAIDTTQATSSNRIKMYVNGSQVTAFDTANYPAQNDNSQLTSANANNYVGSGWSGGEPFDGYMSDVFFIDGQALTPSSFGASNASGVWYPIPYQGTYGTNGFNLKFANSASLGTDSSGNANNFTVNNLTSVDQSTDIPTNNFATMNPLVATGGTYTEGNLQYLTAATDGNWSWSSITPSSGGNWYCEAKMISSSNGTYQVGITAATNGTPRILYVSSGAVYLDGSNVATYATYTTNDIIGMAYNSSTKSLTFYKNGVSQGSQTASSTNDYYFGSTGQSGGATHTVAFNFGSPPYSANGYTDAAGYGNFSYAVPSGYYALCTKNLNTYG